MSANPFNLDKSRTLPFRIRVIPHFFSAPNFAYKPYFTYGLTFAIKAAQV